MILSIQDVCEGESRMLVMFTLGRNFCTIGFRKALCQQWHTLLGCGVKKLHYMEEEENVKISLVKGRKTVLRNKKDHTISGSDL